MRSSAILLAAFVFALSLAATPVAAAPQVAIIQVKGMVCSA